MHSPLSIIPCADLTEAQIVQVRALTVSAQQEEFGGAFKDTLTASLTHPTEAKFGICFFSDSDPIGMVLLKRPRSPDWVSDNEVSLHALKIDQRWQGKGVGKEAFALAIAAAARKWPDAKNLVLSVDADNAAALAVYRGFGMVDSGAVFKGRLGLEHRLITPLHPGEQATHVREQP